MRIKVEGLRSKEEGLRIKVEEFRGKVEEFRQVIYRHKALKNIHYYISLSQLVR